MNVSEEIQKGAELLVKMVARETGYQLDAAQLAEATGKVINSAEQILNAWPEAKKAGQAEKDKITDVDSAMKFNQEK